MQVEVICESRPCSLKAYREFTLSPIGPISVAIDGLPELVFPTNFRTEPIQCPLAAFGRE